MKKALRVLLSLAVIFPLTWPASAETGPFTDVPEGAYYEEAVLWAYRTGVIGGMTETTFVPGTNMRRAELWTALARMKGEALSSGSPWYSGAASWADSNGIATSGTDPLADITREELVLALYRFADRPQSEGSLEGFTDAGSLSPESTAAMAWAVDSAIMGGVSATELAPQGTATRAQVVTILWRYAQQAENGSTQPSPLPEPADLATRSAEADRQIAEARAQFESGDHTHLPEPVQYRVLWIGYTHVTYGELDFRMMDFDQEYLRAVALNFEKVVETYAEGDLDITVDLYFEDAEKTLIKSSNEDWLYLARETVQEDIDRYDQGQYDTVLTTVQTQGTENRQRNQGKPGYGELDVILGLKLDGLEDPLGYSTFNLFLPNEGTYPLEDPTVPSLYATAVAVHEWMHQLEYLGDLLGIEYPSTHAYQGGEAFPGYEACVADQDNYDYFAFYEPVLRGQLPLFREDGTIYVGMYPKNVAPLIKRGALNLGVYTIQAPDGAYLTAREDAPQLTKGADPCRWLIRCGGEGCYVLIPEDFPWLRIDLDNAWDSEGNGVKLFLPTSYADAQRWRLTENGDGTFCIRTAYESQRAVAIDQIGGQAVIRSAKEPSEDQKWVFTCISAY